MRHDRLPDGFGVRLDPRVRTYSGGRYLVGDAPMRLLRLAPEAAALIGDGYLEVTDRKSAVVARRLLDAGVGNPRPRLLPRPEDVTVVVPLHNDTAGLARLLRTLRGHSVIVVDDGSDRPVPIPRTGGRCRVTVLRHERRHGAAAARNAGLRAATTEFVAFVDSDMVPRAGWLEVMLGHFSDPEVALVAPRIVSREPAVTVLGRYEQTRSSLDRGRREAAVGARGVVSYVPGAALLVRRQALLAEGGFDEQMCSAADIDLCRRLERAGWRLRYEPAAQVACDHPVSFRKWFERKVAVGVNDAPAATSTAQLAAPLMTVPFWTVVAMTLLGIASRSSVLGAALTLVAALVRLRRVFAELDNPTRVAAIALARGFSGCVWRIVSAMCRNYWPVTILAMIASRRVRRIALTMAVADGLADWFTHRDVGGLDPVRYLLCKRLDDIAYGTGLWYGVVRDRREASDS